MTFVTPAAWCAALFLATTLFSHTVALRLLLLFAAAMLTAAALVDARLRSTGRGTTFSPPLLLPFALWAAWATLSLFWSVDPELTIKELRNEVGYALVALWVCYVGAQAPGAARIFLSVMAIAAVTVCATALRYAWFPLPESPAWLHGGPGTYSAALLILFPCTLSFLWLALARRWHATHVAAAAALIVLYLISGYTTQNRTLWVGFAVQIGIAACFLLARPQQTPGGGRRRIGMIVGTAVLAVAAVTAIGAKVQSERFGADASMLKDDPRPLLWKAIVPHIEAQPVAGSGFGRGMARHDLRDETRDNLLWHSHNLILDTALQLGAVGLALFALLIGWTAWLGWRLVRVRDDMAAICGVALLGVVAGMLIRNMTDVLWIRQAALLYWGTVGILLGWGCARQRARADAAP